MPGASSFEPTPLITAQPQSGASPLKPAVLRRACSRLLHGRRIWLRASWFMLLCLVPCAVMGALDSGTTWDEEAHRKYGIAILHWFTSGFEDRTATTLRGQYVYGGSFDLLGALIASRSVIPLGIFELLHVLTALIACVGVVATWQLAARVSGAFAGFLAASYLCLTPLWIGHGWFNPKDMPFAVGATLALYASARVALEPAPLSWRSALRAGVCCGLALSVRPGGLFIGAYPLMAAGARWLLDMRARRRSGQPLRPTRSALAIGVRLTVAAALAWALMIAAWPWAQLDPLQRPLRAAALAAHYAWRHRVLFDGFRLWSYALPRSYLPTWFSITLPDVYVIAAVCMPVALIGGLLRRALAWPKLLCVALYTASIVLPLAGVLFTQPILYDAQRHFLFLVPPLAALAGIATAHVLRATYIAAPWRALVLASFAALGCISLYDMQRLHPYEYIYFNRLFGGLPAARDRFETDYWGAANREAFAWVVEHVPPRADGKPIRVGMCYADWQIDYYKRVLGIPRTRIQRVKEPSAQIYIATTRNRCHGKAGQVIHTVERDGVPLVYVLER